MDAIDTALFTELAQIVADLAVAVDAAAFEPRFLDGDQKALVFHGSLAFRVKALGIEAAWVHLEHFAQPAHRELVL